MTFKALAMETVCASKASKTESSKERVGKEQAESPE